MPEGTDTQQPSLDATAQPTPEEKALGVVDPQKKVAEILRHYDRSKNERKQFESMWFTGAAMLRGQQNLQYDSTLAELVSPIIPTSRFNLKINRIRPKVNARNAKFFKSRPKPEILPASTQRKDILDARASQKVLMYHYFKQDVERKHKDARMWASFSAKGFLWVTYDHDKMARVRTTDPITQQSKEEMVPLGDVSIDVGSAFELLVGDATQMRLAKQPWIIRAKTWDIEDVRKRYPQIVQKIEDAYAESQDSTQTTLNRMATLNARDGLFGGRQNVQRPDQLLVIEFFKAPCGDYPQGEYAVVVNEELARYEQALPYNGWEDPINPYPVVEFRDQMTAGQFWNTTLVEQLIDLQREYNFVRSMISENIRMMARPKISVTKQHNLAPGAWTTQAGEILEWTWMPGIPEPRIIQPANIAADCWNLLALIAREFDELTQVYPESEGKIGDATSGFQTNLIQEANNNAHAPDIREDELALQEMFGKVRKLCKLYYDVPRLIAITSPNSMPEVFEFHQGQIDENAEVVIQSGSMLPDLKSSRAQTIVNLFEKGMLGDVRDLQVQKRALSLMELGNIEGLHEQDRRDEDDAAEEFLRLENGQQIMPAQFFQDHVSHLISHQDDLKAAETAGQPGPVQQAKIAHVITHYDWVNPQLAMGLRKQYGFMQSMFDPATGLPVIDQMTGQQAEQNTLPIATPPPVPLPMGANPGMPPGQGPPQPGAQGPPANPQSPPPQGRPS